MTSNSNEMLAGEHALSRAAGMVSAAKADFTRDAANLENQINGMRGRWQGAGGQAFFTLHQAWTEKQRIILSALDEFEASLRTTERDNVSTDETQQAANVNLAGRLDGIRS